MRTPGKIQWLFPFLLFAGLFLLIAFASGFRATSGGDSLSCTPPSVSVTDYSSGSVTFTWPAMDGVTGYEVYYVRQEDNYVSSPVVVGGNTISFSNLPPGTYDFYFRTICGGGTSSYIVEEDLMM